MTNLREQARGECCEIRSPICNYNPETTVLAHYRLIGISGMGLKSPDLIAAHACSDCHDLVDGRRHVVGLQRTDVQLLHLQGVVRTQAKLIKRGLEVSLGGNRHASPTIGRDSVLAGAVPVAAVPAGGAADADRVRREEAP